MFHSLRLVAPVLRNSGRIIGRSGARQHRHRGSGTVLRIWYICLDSWPRASHLDEIDLHLVGRRWPKSWRSRLPDRPLTAMMIMVVTFVSLMVHVYTIGYMADDPGYTRFFAYISAFTFSMLMLVMSNNFLQLFFGWEAVGLVSYLLIGFWYTRPTAIYASLKAFLANRVGDFGFVLGLRLIVASFGSLDYASVFNAPALGPAISMSGDAQASVLTAICIGLFVGAMGKSAQFPLHVWLPDSMEGPTPISALIHAATMVTAGIFMVARMSPLFELSETALSFVTIIGATTALFMGLLGVVQNDIKRVIAYSTLSAPGLHDRRARRLGVSGGDLPSDHARVFQGAAVPGGRLGDHCPASRAGPAQDGRAEEIHADYLLDRADRGAGARRRRRLAGFFSKDAIIEAVGLSQVGGHGYAQLR